ncbi:DNA repair protein RadC [Candidatus Binatia bacterium]|nr:DNA repair protein RadC [Candidatus Binatia bacterium]
MLHQLVDAAADVRSRDVPDLDRPRERLQHAGVEALSDVELLALLLRAGHRGASALDLARRLHARYGGIADLAAASPHELASVAGIGPAHAAAICAAVALGRRIEGRTLARGDRIGGSADVFRHFRACLAGLAQERFYVLLLDGKGRVMRDVRVSEGTLTASLVHPREVFRLAIREAAASVILVHNHPSGDPTPSPEDVTLTARLRSAGDLVGIKVVDHVVVGHHRYASLVDLGQM